MFDYATARENMLNSQIRTNDVTDTRILQAFRRVERERFVPRAKMALAYGDAHIDLGEGCMIIKPRDFAKMVEAADIEPTDIVLDIACGRGYSVAILAQLAETVIGVETDPKTVSFATEILEKTGVRNAAVLAGDLRIGAAEHGPFNVIFAEGAVTEVPAAWLGQLADGGRLVVPLRQGPVNRVCVYTKAGNSVGERVVFDSTTPVLPGFGKQPEFAL